MTLIEPTQPTQPTQPGIVPTSVLQSEFADYVATDAFVEHVVANSRPRWRSRNEAVDTALVQTWARAVVDGVDLGGEAAFQIGLSGSRTLYGGPFRPFIPFEERNPAMKYGGAAMVIGGAILAAAWPDSPATQNLSVTPTLGGVKASKSFSF